MYCNVRSFTNFFPQSPLAICRLPQTKPKSLPINKEGTGSGGNLDLCEKLLCASLQRLETLYAAELWVPTGTAPPAALSLWWESERLDLLVVLRPCRSEIPKLLLPAAEGDWQSYWGIQQV